MHFEKEKELFGRGIKCLSLFFIDEVAKYRQYDEDGNEINSDYGDIFEEEYNAIESEYLTLFSTPYEEYLKGIETAETHRGYFSVDKKGHKVNSTTKRGSDESDDISAYDLIMKEKELLLSFDNPVRFIFSHSALREGWDNPNVFQICTLKHGGSSSTQKRQEQDSIFSFYQQLIRLRHERPLIAEGSITFLERKNTDIIAYQRELDGEKLVVFCNFRSHEVSLQEESLQEYTEAGFSKLLGNYEGLEKNLRPFEVAALIR